MNNLIIGTLFALCAAALNASIGVISKLLMHSGLNPQDIAFLKTIIAFFFLSVFLFKVPVSQKIAFISSTPSKLSVFTQIAICAFLGIFSLFFFETIAYNHGAAANVVVVLMASAAISALFFGRFILKESIYIHSLIGTLLAVAGISIISWKGENSLLMLINASIAGTGYGLFSVLVKKFKLNGGLFLTKYLLLFGSVYLAVPFLVNLHTINFNIDIVLGLIGLAVLPTILGFFCTTKALSYMSAAKVQVTELSEPIFAALMAWVFIHEQPTLSFLYGAIFIISGIFLMNRAPKSN
ncbi:DMT family transporter [Acinetobacter baumannii]|nr:DMT family transporter [Acinetobacter baumannii]MDC5218528.1 DMT family transporter [Acinetobacter baumannii]